MPQAANVHVPHDIPILEVAVSGGVRHPLVDFHNAAQEYFLQRDKNQRIDYGTLPVDMIFSRKPDLIPGVQSCVLCSTYESSSNLGPVPANCQPEIYCFQLNDDPVGDEMFDGDEEIAAMQITDLPHSDLSGLWESLFYQKEVKRDLLCYASTAMEFSNMGVDTNIIGCNRLIFCHGPPGTGKTSLCKALAHKLSIRAARQFKSAQLLEINAHSLFSRWFSESGKLVQRLFSKVHELLEDPENLVILLVDEVESLAASRQQAMQANEPTDAIRVVNALLTQIDRLKTFTNALVMTTSNVTEALDGAFVDRADYKVFLGEPSDRAVYTILKQSVEELIKVGLVKSNDLIPTYDESCGNTSNMDGISLLNITKMTTNFSGRTLRKLPFQAIAFHIPDRRNGQPVQICDLFDGLLSAVQAEITARDDMDPTKNKVMV